MIPECMFFANCRATAAPLDNPTKRLPLIITHKAIYRYQITTEIAELAEKNIQKRSKSKHSIIPLFHYSICEAKFFLISAVLAAPPLDSKPYRISSLLNKINI